MIDPTYARDISELLTSGIHYSICTLVTRPSEYETMRRSFVAGGFGGEDCEYLFIDNSRSNDVDAFQGYNRFLAEAKGKYIILCHQDIVLIADPRDVLDKRLAELEKADPDWGLCGNAGATTTGAQEIRISDRYGEDTTRGGPFPAAVMSLDENFIVARRDANLALSHDLHGFHWYGSDICIVADVLGYKSYVIDFHLRHGGKGNVDRRFHEGLAAIAAKYQRAFRPRRHFVVHLISFEVVPAWPTILAWLKQRSAEVNRKCSSLPSKMGRRLHRVLKPKQAA
jgi:hypothetical protein